MVQKLIALLLLLCCCSCVTRYVQVPINTEIVKTEYRTKLVTDSIVIADTVHIYDKNDTVFVEKTRNRYKVLRLNDTIIARDTARIEKPVIVEVEKTVTNSKILVWAIISTAIVLTAVAWKVKGFFA